MLDVTVFCFFASYLLALIFEVLRAVGGRAWLRWPAFVAAAAGLVAHTFFIWNRGQTLEMAPLLASPRDFMFVVAWIACVLYLFVVAYDRRVGIGLFALPVVLVFVVVGNFSSGLAPAAASSGGTGMHRWLLLHVSLLGLGIAAVIAGVVLSLMYLAQHHRLKRKWAGRRGFQLLSLERLAQWNHFSILVAVPLLSLGLVAGVLLVFLGQSQGADLTLYDPFVIASSLAWLVMIFVLGRALRIQQAVGKTIAVRTLLGFGLLLTTLLGLYLATGGGHTAASHATAPAAPQPAPPRRSSVS